MRNCPNCGHTFDDKDVSPPNCPSCGREFTVSDIGAATIDFGALESAEMPPPSAATVIASRPGSLLQPPDASGSAVVDGTSMTLQSGRWTPSAEELADAASSPEMLRTIDSSFLGSAASGMMQTLESGFVSGEVSGVMK